MQMVMSMNALDPDLMSPDERLAAVAAILAAGLIRLRARQSSQLSGDWGESSLDCPPDRRRHVGHRSMEITR
jgi:hypothetical protein